MKKQVKSNNIIKKYEQNEIREFLDLLINDTYKDPLDDSLSICLEEDDIMHTNQVK